MWDRTEVVERLLQVACFVLLYVAAFQFLVSFGGYQF